MNNCHKLSNVTKDYLNTFYHIFDKMVEGMTTAELGNSISYNFIVQMIPHHRGAIEMSENLLRFTTYLPLQEMAEQIISEQTQSIENMQDIQCSCKMISNCNRDLCLYQRKMEQIMQTMFRDMDNAPDTNNVNVDFIREMLPHHLGAVKMSKTTLQYDICPQLRPILEAIISSQEREIIQMQQMLRSLNC